MTLIDLILLLLIGVICIAISFWLIDTAPFGNTPSYPNVKGWAKFIIALIIVLILLSRTGIFASGPILR